jgi:RNA polymerase sigma factor (sigma-70 family)
MNLNQLLKDAGKNDPIAQKRLFDQYSGTMLLVCRRYIKDFQDAEEMLLNGFFKFFSSIESFQYINEAALYSWIKRIMINECLMFLRKKMAFVVISDLPTEDHPAEDDVLDKLNAEDIFRLVLELPAGYRTVFNLHAIEGWEHKEISKTLGISEGTSKSQLNKARKLLKKNLSQQGLIYEQRKTK